MMLDAAVIKTLYEVAALCEECKFIFYENVLLEFSHKSGCISYVFSLSVAVLQPFGLS